MVLTYQEAVEAGARALRERAIADQRRAGEVTDAEWDELLSISDLIDLRIEGAPEIIAAAVLEAVGYADLLAETERLRAESQRFYENRNLWQSRAESAEAERDALSATVARVEAHLALAVPAPIASRFADVVSATGLRAALGGAKWNA